MSNAWDDRVQSYRDLADQIENRARDYEGMAKDWLLGSTHSDNYASAFRLQVKAETYRDLTFELRRYKTTAEMEELEG